MRQRIGNIERMTSKIRFESSDQFGRRAAYVFCPACQQEHSFGTVYPDGSVEVQFSDEFGISREDAEAMVAAAFKRVLARHGDQGGR